MKQYTITYKDNEGLKENKVETISKRTMTRSMVKNYFCKKKMQEIAKWLLFGSASFEMRDEDGNKIAWGRLTGSVFGGWMFNIDVDNRFVA